MPTKEPFRSPFRILVDGREKRPYRFDQLVTDAAHGSRPIVVETAYHQLRTGDYTIEGCESMVAVERKSKQDLYSTLGQHRGRFEEEHERLAGFGAGNAIVIIESSWDDLLGNPPKRSRLVPKVVHRTALSWLQRYGVPWFAMGSRELAEVTTFRFLEKWYYELQATISKRSGVCRICGKPLKDHKSIARGMGPVCAYRADPRVAQRIRRGER